MYFKKFPKMLYAFDLAGTEASVVVTDITRNVRFRKEVLSNITIYDEYDIIDNETPEIIAEKVYGNPNYHWIVMLVNDRYDYVKDFPLSYNDMEKYIDEKYGSTRYDVHHYVDNNGFTVSNPNIDWKGQSQPAIPVTNSDYEYTINESKRRIKIVPKSIIDTILKEFNEMI